MPNPDDPVAQPARSEPVESAPAMTTKGRGNPRVQLSPRVHALLGGVNCAIVDLGEGAAMLVDSGQDKEHGRKIRKALNDLGLAPSVILCTHSHADHFGGNAYLLRQFPEARVWAPEIEAEIMRAPQLEPIYLFHGAKPLPELTGKWLQADASPVHEVVGAGERTLGAVSFELLDVRGHAHRQLAVLVDGVLLATDSVFGEATLTKYPLPFSQDVGGQLAAFERVGAVEANVALPGHGEPTTELAELAAKNRDVVLAAAAAVEAACQGVGTEEVLARTTEALGLAMDDLPRFHLNLTTVSAYLGWLREQGRVEAQLSGGRLRWSQAGVTPPPP